MQTHVPAQADQAKQQQSKTVPQPTQLVGEQQGEFVDNRPEMAAGLQLRQLMDSSRQAVGSRALQAMINNSAQAREGSAMQAMMNKSTLAREAQSVQLMLNTIAQANPPVQRVEEEEPLQAKAASENTAQLETAAEAPKPNNTGLPDNLKSGIESLSGMSMDHVKVHYNSSQPAQLNAHAYAQGSEIHVAPGQEQHVPHEAWHVVQQAQGRVKPTVQMKGGVPVNDDVGLESEADVMGAKALQTKADVRDSRPEPGSPRQLVQLRSMADHYTAQRCSAPAQGQAAGQSPMQLVAKEIGAIDHSDLHPGGIIDHIKVIAELGEDNTYSWPTDASGHFFNPASYKGSVARAMLWGSGGGEGTAGWYARGYTPDQFHNLAVAAGTASDGLPGVLASESNKTLVAIRTFRGSEMGMAQQTANDLAAVLTGVNAKRADLELAHLIADQTETVTEVKSDPAEAHPNTLPTARITFSGGETLYFKGRSGSVEDALVGATDGAALPMSALGAAHIGDEVGAHGFVSDDSSHLSKDVGAPGPRGAVTDEEAIRAWVSAARTAALVSLTGTGDLHGSNVIDGASATKHIIDAEFLLDGTAWARYEAAAQANEIANFSMASMAPKWVRDHMPTLSMMKKLQLSDEVGRRFHAMGLNNTVTLDTVLAPILALIANEVLLRISPEPFVTAFWLTTITEFHSCGAEEQDTLLNDIWNLMAEVYPDSFHIDLKNKQNVLLKMRENFGNGMVPLFHLAASTGIFYMNKDTCLGQIREDRSAARFLDLTKAGLIAGYDNMVLKVKAAVLEG